MLAFLMPLINGLLGSFLLPFFKAWTDYRLTYLKTTEAGFEAGASADAKNIATVSTAEIQNNALKVSLYGTMTFRIITLIAGLPPATHFGLVYIDTILASKAFLGAAYFGVPKLPTPYDTFEWAVVSSFFLVQAVNIGKSNVAAWLERVK